MASPSPIVTVQDGAGAPQTVVPFDVTAGNVVTVQLASLAGVSSWSLVLFGQDDNVTPPTVTVNNTTKTATFTAPAAPWTLIYRSVVNNGIDINGVTQPSYTTTVGIHCKTAGGLRLAASNETTESNTSLGWTKKVNDAIRNTAGVTAPLTLTGSSDVTQLTVKANATQATQLTQWQTSAGVTTLGISGDGSTIQWGAAVAAPTIKVADNTTASATGTTTTYGGQNCTGVMSTGGAVALRSGSGTTAAGAINSYLGASGAPIMTLAATAADLGGGNYPVVLDASGGAGNGVVAKVGGVSVASLQQVAGDFAAFGVNPSATGAVRLANALAIKARNVGNTADYQLIASDSSNNVIVGSTTSPANVNVFGTPASSLLIADGFLGCYFGSGATGFVFRSNGGTNGVAVLGSTTSAAWTWDAAQTAPTWTQATLAGTGANAGATSTLQAQAGQAQTGAAANNNGGGFNIKTGAAGTGGTGAAGLPGVLGLFAGATQFAALSLANTDYLALGATPSGTGAIRFGNGTNGIWFRNAANSADLRLVQNDNSNNVYLGATNSGAQLILASGTACTITSSATQVASLGAASSDYIALGASAIGTGYIRMPSATATGAALAITLNATMGTITTESLTTAAGGVATYTVTNSQVTANSRIFVTIGGGTNTTAPVYATNIKPGAGSFTVDLRNAGGVALNGTLVFSFWVI